MGKLSNKMSSKLRQTENKMHEMKGRAKQKIKDQQQQQENISNHFD